LRLWHLLPALHHLRLHLLLRRQLLPLRRRHQLQWRRLLLLQWRRRLQLQLLALKPPLLTVGVSVSIAVMVTGGCRHCHGCMHGQREVGRLHPVSVRG
jgi:hypothetical protein